MSAVKMTRQYPGPSIRIQNPHNTSHNAGGVGCCFIRCCTCVHVDFLKSTPGLIKLIETIISGFIQSLLINYGLRYSTTIGSAFEGSLTTSSACFLISAILLACYIFSEKSYKLIRQSLFEVMFNSLACFLYLSSASCLALATKMFLAVQYYTVPGYEVYPAMTLAYMLSGLIGVIHGFDAYFSYLQYRGTY